MWLLRGVEEGTEVGQGKEIQHNTMCPDTPKSARRRDDQSQGQREDWKGEEVKDGAKGRKEDKEEKMEGD